MYKKLISQLKQMLDFNKNKLIKFTPKHYVYPLDLESFKKLLFFAYATSDRSGYICSLDRNDPTLAQQNIFLTYGELLPDGLNRLFQFIKPDHRDSFVDLGSGAGKLVLQSFLCTDMAASYGVEIDPARYKISATVLSDLREKLPHIWEDHNNRDNKRIIEFQNCNLLDFDFNKVSIILANATCFGPNLMGQIVDRVNNSSSVRAIMSTHSIEGLVNLTNHVSIEVETSWHVPPATSNCYLYFI